MQSTYLERDIMEDYNEEPVFYCTHCLSLKIKGLEGYDYCDDCGGTDIETTDIFTWRQMYKDRYGKDF